MVTPIIVALFGSSFHLVSGPTTAISIVVFTAVSHHAQVGSPEFIATALTLTFLAGVYQLFFGLARLGGLVNFVSHTVVIGFTAEAAILIDFHYIKQIVNSSKFELLIFVVTFLAALLLELEFAIYLGVLLSLMIFLSRTPTPKISSLSINQDKYDDRRHFLNIEKKPLSQCPQLKVISMSIYFGSVAYIQSHIGKIIEREKIYHILLIGNRINFIDLSGVEVLLSEHKYLQKYGDGLYFVRLNIRIYEFIVQTGFIKSIGKDYFFDNKAHAINSIYQKLDKAVCQNCSIKLFNKCQPKLTLTS